MVEFGDQKALGSQLLHHFESEEKPITFIVGSGLTCNTVPGVQWYVDRMRSRFTGDELDDFDGQVQGPTQAQKYQQAAKFAKTHRNQRWLNAIIGWGVLQAMPGGDGMSFEDAQEISRDERFLSDVEQDRSYWSLGEGVEAFGSLLAMTATRRWLVVTTNFDPLIEVSIQDSGEDPHTHALADDAKINRPLGRQKIEIAHVHGYYRSSTTLNAQSELDQSRPILTGSIKERLRGHYVVVCGYGGWRDCFTKVLLKQIKEDQDLDMEISWAWHGPSVEEGPIVDALGKFRAITQYEGVDVNELFPKLVQSL